MNRWLVKSEPSVYAWSQLVADGRTAWTGVRNNTARLHLLAMKVGDEVLYYHTDDDRQVVAVARVVKEAYTDPTAEDPRWVCVDLEPLRALAKPVPLAAFKADPALVDSWLVKLGRLSVLPLTEAQYQRVLELGA